MMASNVSGIVIANSHDELITKLTEHRSTASVPFGGRYRLIDFTLSNLVNAGVTNIGIIAREKYRALMDHVGSGIFWDLDRKNGGLHILPPYNTSNARRYRGYVEAIKGAMDFVHRCNTEYIILCDSATVANVDISAVMSFHAANNADVTVVYHNGAMPCGNEETMQITVGDNNRITDIQFDCFLEDEINYGLGITVFTRSKLIELIEEAYLNEDTSINRDILAKKLNSLNIYGYLHQGYAVVMNNSKTYFNANMQLLEKDVRRDLFNKERPIYTKTRDDMPTRYGTKSKVENCFIGDGCVVDGTVKNSILFRGVTVEKGAVVENSILMQGVTISENAQVNYVVSDKNASIGSDMTIKGTKDKAFFIRKNQAL